MIFAKAVHAGVPLRYTAVPPANSSVTGQGSGPHAPSNRNSLVPRDWGGSMSHSMKYYRPMPPASFRIQAWGNRWFGCGRTSYRSRYRDRQAVCVPFEVPHSRPKRKRAAWKGQKLQGSIRQPAQPVGPVQSSQRFLEMIRRGKVGSTQCAEEKLE